MLGMCRSTGKLSGKENAAAVSGLHARGEGEQVLALESREGTRASRRSEAPWEVP